MGYHSQAVTNQENARQELLRQVGRMRDHLARLEKYAAPDAQDVWAPEYLTPRDTDNHASSLIAAVYELRQTAQMTDTMRRVDEAEAKRGHVPTGPVAIYDAVRDMLDEDRERLRCAAPSELTATERELRAEVLRQS